MRHATTDRVGHIYPARRKKAKDIVQADQQLRLRYAKTERRGRSSKGQAQGSACGDAAAGFLRSVFLPKLCIADSVNTDDTTAKATARDFYKSLAQLAAHYGIEPMQSKGYPYPYNIALAIWDINKKLEREVKDFYKLRLVRGKKVFFLVEERYNTGSTLYYIPVIPLYRMLRSPKHRSAACLLLSVCCYLYHIADIPYYRQGGSYLYWQYEMVTEMILDDAESEYAEDFKRELHGAFCIGDLMEKKIYSQANLTVFRQRLDNFCCRSELDNACYHLACRVFELYRQYPQESIFRYGGRMDNGHATYEDDDGDGSLITMNRYISFVHSTVDSLYNTYISDMVNNDFNEYAGADEPVLRRCFNGREVTGEHFDLERRLFTLLDELAFLLNNY